LIVPDLRVIQGGMANTPPKGVIVGGGIVPANSVEKRRALLEAWILDVKAASLAHRTHSRHRGSINQWLGGTVIVLSIAAIALSASTGGPLGIVGTCVSAIATICACFQTFSRTSETSAKSHQAAAEFAAIQRKIQILLTEDDPPKESLDAINEERLRLTAQCPVIPDRFNREARREVGLPPKPVK
jgi:hypothetical protein